MSKIRAFITTVLLLLWFAATASAASIALAWDANTEPEVTGYVVMVLTVQSLARLLRAVEMWEAGRE